MLEFFQQQVGEKIVYRSADVVRHHFVNNFPSIGKKLNARTLRRWHAALMKEPKAIHKRGRKRVFPIELVNQSIHMVKKLSDKGTPIDQNVAR